MKKKFLFITVGLILMMVSTWAVAYAGFIWGDPVVSVAGTEVNIHIGLDLPEGATLDKPVKVGVAVPKDVEAHVVNPQGAKVKIVHAGYLKEGPQGIPFVVGVLAHKLPGEQTYPVQVRVDTGSQVFTGEGVAGQPIEVEAWLPAP